MPLPGDKITSAKDVMRKATDDHGHGKQIRLLKEDTPVEDSGQGKKHKTEPGPRHDDPWGRNLKIQKNRYRGGSEVRNQVCGFQRSASCAGLDARSRLQT